jgi:hypothetical protein
MAAARAWCRATRPARRSVRRPKRSSRRSAISVTGNTPQRAAANSSVSGRPPSCSQSSRTRSRSAERKRSAARSWNRTHSRQSPRRSSAPTVRHRARSLAVPYRGCNPPPTVCPWPGRRGASPWPCPRVWREGRPPRDRYGRRHRPIRWPFVAFLAIGPGAWRMASAR